MLKYQIVSISYLFLFFACAVQSYPTGGPRDIEGPHIVKVEPNSNSQNIKNNSIIKIIYDEMIEPSIIKSAIKIYPETEVNIKCHGNKIEIKPKDKWPNDIFRIVCSRSIKDFNANISDSCRVFAFSKSKIIQKNKIYGSIANYDSSSFSHIGLFEYNANLDSFVLNHAIENDYQGKYNFSNIENGEYLLVASQNKIKDIYKEIRTNNYSISTETIKVNDNNSLDNNLYLFHPAERLKVKSVDMLNSYFGIIELTNGHKINYISNVYEFDYMFDNDDNILRLNLESVNDSINLEFVLNNNVEEYKVKHKINSNFIMSDTISPKIIDYKVSPEKIELLFSEPIKINKNIDDVFSAYKNIFIEDSTNIEIENYELDYSPINPLKIEITNDLDTLKNIKIKNSFITDLSGNNLLDSVLTINSNISKKEIKGGDVFGNILYEGNNDVIVEIKNADINYKTKTFDNNFHFINVSPGIYQIWAYEDINNLNSNYFNGTLSPLKHSAKFDIYGKDIELRSKWDIEGIILNLK